MALNRGFTLGMWPHTTCLLFESPLLNHIPHTRSSNRVRIRSSVWFLKSTVFNISKASKSPSTEAKKTMSKQNAFSHSAKSKRRLLNRLFNSDIVTKQSRWFAAKFGSSQHSYFSDVKHKKYILISVCDDQGQEMVPVWLIYAEQRIRSVKGSKTSFILMREIVSYIQIRQSREGKSHQLCGFTPTFGHFPRCCTSLKWKSGLEAASGTLEEPTIRPLKFPLNPLKILISRWNEHAVFRLKV